MSEQTGEPIKLVSWNIAQRRAPWEWLPEMDADVALLQEAGPPPRDTGLEVNPGAWQTAGDEAQRLWRCAVVKLSARVEVEWIPTVPLTQAGRGALGVSRPGTLAGAVISADGCEPFTALSMYAPWETGPRQPQSWMWADASAHRMISDLSLLIAKRGTRIVAAGDLNILHGYGEHRQAYPGARYATVFDRMRALGLPFAGPQAPNGRQADPWPDELPKDSKDVPTFHHTRQTPETATRQLDFVFASPSMDVEVHALNRAEEWGPSDHCRVTISVRGQRGDG